jgi:hypothetical protein
MVAMLAAVPCLLAMGCAHQRDQYAYAPPLAPPVYSQPPGYATPPVNPAATPAVMPSPVAAAPVTTTGGVPVIVPVAGAVAGDPCAGVVTAAGGFIDAPCESANPIVMTDGGFVVDEGHSVGCPQEFVSEVVVPDSAIR